MNTFLAIFYSFSFAFSPFYKSGDIDVKRANTISSEFGVDLFDHTRIYGGFSSMQIPREWNNYRPIVQRYSIGAEGHFDLNSRTHLDIGVKRECAHPLRVWRHQISRLDEAHLTFYVKMNGTVPLITY